MEVPHVMNLPISFKFDRNCCIAVELRLPVIKKIIPADGKPKMTEQEKEITRLKKELSGMRMERDILKKAVNTLSKNDGNFTIL